MDFHDHRHRVIVRPCTVKDERNHSHRTSTPLCKPIRCRISLRCCTLRNITHLPHGFPTVTSYPPSSRARCRLHSLAPSTLVTDPAFSPSLFPPGLCALRVRVVPLVVGWLLFDHGIMPMAEEKTTNCIKTRSTRTCSGHKLACVC